MMHVSIDEVRDIGTVHYLASLQKQQYEFLNVTGSTELDDLGRTTVRAQALRDYHRKRKAPDGGSQRPRSTETPPSVKVLNLRFRLGSEGLKKTAGQPLPLYARTLTNTIRDREHHDSSQRNRRSRQPNVKSRGRKGIARLTAAPENMSGQLDPFDALPLPATPRIRHLVRQRQYIHPVLRDCVIDPSLVLMRVTSNSPGTDYRRAWFQYAVHDEAFFYVALCHSASDSQLTLCIDDNPEALTYRSSAIRLLNERLNDPLSRLNDSTIAVVAALASYEIASASYDAAKTHTAGLEAMVKLRGGLSDRSFGAKLRRLLLWTDLSAAGFCYALPRFTCGTCSTWHAEGPTSSRSHSIGSHVFSDRHVTHSSLSLSDVFSDLRELSHAKARLKFATDLHEDADMTYGDQVYRIQRFLMTLTYDEMMDEQDPGRTAQALAALIYIHSFLNETSYESRVVGTIHPRLVCCIDRLSNLAATDIHPLSADSKRIFWATRIGTAVVGGKALQSICLQAMNSLRLKYRLDSAELSNAVLREVAWDEALDVSRTGGL